MISGITSPLAFSISAKKSFSAFFVSLCVHFSLQFSIQYSFIIFLYICTSTAVYLQVNGPRILILNKSCLTIKYHEEEKLSFNDPILNLYSFIPPLWCFHLSEKNFLRVYYWLQFPELRFSLLKSDTTLLVQIKTNQIVMVKLYSKELDYFPLLNPCFPL